jgi:hypothetical protein
VPSISVFIPAFLCAAKNIVAAGNAVANALRDHTLLRPQQTANRPQQPI